MGLGFGKGFVIAVLVALFFAIGMKDYKVFFLIVGAFAVVKIVWKLLTK